MQNRLTDGPTWNQSQAMDAVNLMHTELTDTLQFARADFGWSIVECKKKRTCKTHRDEIDRSKSWNSNTPRIGDG